MREVSEDLVKILQSATRDVALVVDVMRGSDRLFKDVHVDGWELSWKLDAKSKAQGQLNLTLVDDNGFPMTPRMPGDAFSPFGGSIAARLDMSAGDVASTSVQAGLFQIDAAPSARDYTLTIGGRVIVTGAELELDVSDQLAKIALDSPIRPEQTREGATCWDEIARLSKMPVSRNVPDKPCPTLSIELKVGAYLDTIEQIMEILGGTPYVNSAGAITCITPQADPTATLTYGPTDGAILYEEPRTIRADGVKNCVIGTFETANREPVWVEPAQITEGPLAADGPFGRRPVIISDESVKTTDAARNRLAEELARVSVAHIERVFTAPIDPRLEIGDTVTVTVEVAAETVTGQVTDLRWRDNDEMAVTLLVDKVISNV